jgi:hypothetical protein
VDYVNGAAPNRDLSFNAGWALIGAAGYRPTPRFRVELEGGGRNNSISSINPGSGAGGSASATTLMLNGYVDIPIRSPITPTSAQASARLGCRRISPLMARRSPRRRPGRGRGRSSSARARP